MTKQQPHPKSEAEGPLDRYMAVLELIAAFQGAITLADVSSILGLPKTTAHRLLKGLVKVDLAKDGAGGHTYQLGERLIRLLHASVDDGWITTLARPHLVRLSNLTSETIYLTRLIGSRVVVVVSQTPDARWRGYVQPGTEMPPNAAATAKAILAYQSKATIAEALATELPKLTSNTRTDRKWVQKELAEVRRRGYATCIGEIDEGLAALAAPIVQPSGAVFHSLGLTGPLQRIMNDQMPERLAALQAAAAELAPVLSLGEKLKSKPQDANAS
ncbi:MAG TPA: IclR family transcriptional regulator [Xanthobacteraceae bacterium]|nr:IclR family transcriptional regulator [Xanthobacteraceae bacterium]